MTGDRGAPRDALDTTAASQTADRGLGDALDVVTQHLAVTLRAALAQTLATFATTRHVFFSDINQRDHSEFISCRAPVSNFRRF